MLAHAKIKKLTQSQPFLPFGFGQACRQGGVSAGIFDFDAVGRGATSGATWVQPGATCGCGATCRGVSTGDTGVRKSSGAFSGATSGAACGSMTNCGWRAGAFCGAGCGMMMICGCCCCTCDRIPSCTACCTCDHICCCCCDHNSCTASCTCDP